jgi:hypothetical protein
VRFWRRSKQWNYFSQIALGNLRFDSNFSWDT